MIDNRTGWKESLARVACVGTGFLCLVLPQLGRGFEVPAPCRLVIEIFVGLLLIGYPSLVTRGYMPPRSQRIAPLLALAAALLSGTWGWGWPPGAVLDGSLLAALSGLLLGRTAMVVVILAEGGALYFGSYYVTRAVGERWMSSVDPGQFNHWLQFSAMFATVAAVLFSVVRRASGHVDTAFNQARRDEALAQRSLSAFRSSRNQRLDAERELRNVQTLQAVGQLSGGFAHLLNNALMVARGALEELEIDCTMKVRKKSEAAITEAAQKVARSIRQLMVFGRQRPKAPSKLDILSEIEDITRSFQATLPENIDLQVHGSPGHFTWVDPASLRQLVLNLLLNAVDALPNGGNVRLTLQASAPLPANDFVGAQQPIMELVVEDDGSGMPPSVTARATDAFFGTKSHSEHAGLGLTIAAGIAEQEGGSLHLESAVGKGTRVSVQFPCDGSTDEDNPTPLLHSSLEPRDSLEFAPQENVEVQAHDARHDRHSWKEVISQRLARTGWVAAALGFILLNVVSSDYFSMPLSLFGFGVMFVCLAIAGWANLRVSARSAWLLTGTLGLTLFQLLGSSYMMAGLVVCMLIIVAWSTLLLPPKTTTILIALLSLTLLAIGQIQPLHTAFGHFAGGSFVAPGNWRRLAFMIPLTQLLLGLSMRAILQHAQLATHKAHRAATGMRLAQDQELQEGNRMLALEREISRSERLSATGQAVSCVAHDLNNALQGLMGPASFLSDPDFTEEQVDSLRHDIWHGIEQASGIAAQLSLEEGGVPLLPSGLLLAEAIERSTNTMQVLIGSNFDLIVECSPTGAVELSESSLRRILFNLVTNARDALQGSGAIEIRVEHVNSQVTLEVTDNGKGMDESTRSRVLEPFFTTKAAGKGTGLGLHSVAQLVEQSGGVLTVNSQVGRGTTIRMLWQYSEPDKVEASPLSQVYIRKDSSRGTLLVVEDEELIRSLLTRSLKKAGYRVLSAPDGDSALRLLDTTRTCVALCIDGIIPGASSADVIEKFRKRYPHSPIVLCSGHLPSNLLKRGLLTSAVTLLAKPFAPRELSLLLEQLTTKQQTLAVS